MQNNNNTIQQVLLNLRMVNRLSNARTLLPACLVLFSFILNGCSVFTKEDPFARAPEKELQTLSGEVFPFSVSISTSATHRLEKDKKLVAYLFSDVVELAEFEGMKVEVDGFYSQEKMREIFSVEAIRLQGLDLEKEEKTDERFLTKKFTFLYPKHWEVSISPDGTAYFLDKNDPARRVFLTFSVEDITKKDKSSEPNILIANFTGIKKIETDEFDRERQEVMLFSNISNQKYVFSLTSHFEEFEKKKAFFKLLNSFVEGEESVQVAQKEEKKELAKQEARKIKKEDLDDVSRSAVEVEPEQGQAAETVKQDESAIDILKNMFEEDVPTESAIEKVVQMGTLPSLPNPFTNLIDARAFDYKSDYYGFSVKIPYGYWFKNFGPKNGSLTRMAIADHEIADESKAEFWFAIIESPKPPSEITEMQSAGNVILKAPRTATSYFQIAGPERFRDAMWSVISAVENFK